jgi:hypothetical protein
MRCGQSGIARSHHFWLNVSPQSGSWNECILAATAQNLRKMTKKIPMPTPRPAKESAKPLGRIGDGAIT